MWDIAPEYGAGVVFAEHRFYGKTQPFGDDSYKSVQNLGYLSSEQALADFAVLIQYLKDEVRPRIRVLSDWVPMRATNMRILADQRR